MGNTFEIKNGKITALKYVQVKYLYTCDCYCQIMCTIEWPESTTVKGPVNVTGVKCPQCEKQVVLPAASYRAENFMLIKEELPESH